MRVKARRRHGPHPRAHYPTGPKGDRMSTTTYRDGYGLAVELLHAEAHGGTR